MGGYLEYPEYKDSGVEWLDKIPTHWQVVRISNVTSKITNGYVGPTRDILVDSGTRYIQSLHIKDGKILFDRGAYFVEEEWSNQHKKSRLNVNDVLLVQTGDIGQTAVVTEEYEGCNCHALIIMTPVKEKVTGGFFEFFLRSHTGQSVLKTLQTGALHPHLNCTLVKDVKFAVPPISEQESIARFLDYKTAQIDALIAKKETLLAKLAEKRTALISQAVTKGLDPTVPMKDSGIEWLGNIPAHWDTAKVKYFARCFNGSTPSTTNPDYWENGTVPWLSSGKTNEDEVTEPSEYISEQALKECSLRVASKGSVIIGIVGQGKTRGSSAYLALDTTINQNMAAIAPNQHLNGKFLHFFLQQAYEPIRNFGRGANQPALDVGLVGRIPIPVVPIQEQLQIVEMLKDEEVHFQKTAKAIGEAVSKLKEYRTALITNAVTGKIDVRDVKLPELESLEVA